MNDVVLFILLQNHLHLKQGVQAVTGHILENTTVAYYSHIPFPKNLSRRKNNSNQRNSRHRSLRKSNLYYATHVLVEEKRQGKIAYILPSFYIER